MTTEQKNTLIRAINHFGVEHQIDKAIEEMGELITALARRRLDRSRKEDIAEEIADVLIVANQLRIIYGGELVDGLIDQKLSRLEDTINGDWRRQERMMPKGMVVHREEPREESEARNGSLIGKCVGAGLMDGLKSVDPDLAEKVAKAPSVFIPANDMRERVAAVAKKRRTTNGDHVEAAFHGEVWARCRLCGKAYEQQSEVKGELPGESYCPWCNGYGKEEGSDV
jgi:NTP pyrophosphatase (non-canonical NTP hydrolase)